MAKRGKSNGTMKGRQTELKIPKKATVLSRSALSLDRATFEKSYLKGRNFATRQRYNRAWMEFQRKEYKAKFETPEAKYLPKDLTYRLSRGLKGQYLTRVKLWTTIPDGSKKVLYKFIAHENPLTSAELGRIISNWELDYELIIHKWRRQGGYRHESLDDRILTEVLAQGMPSP